MKVTCIRLNSGEEIIGRVVETLTVAPDDNQPKGVITLEKVRSINMQPMGHDKIGIGFLPYVIGNPDGKLNFILENCAQTIYDPTSDIENGYMQQTSDIQLARPGMQM